MGSFFFLELCNVYGLVDWIQCAQLGRLHMFGGLCNMKGLEG